MSVIRFKVELYLRHDPQPVFHRFTGAYTFSELSTVISHLWGERPKHSILNYVDDEGDAVRITSESDWEECVRIFQRCTASVLRLTGKRLTKPKRAAATESCSSDSEAEPTPTKSCSSDSEAEPTSTPTTPTVVVDDDVSVVEDPHLDKADSSSTIPLVPEMDFPRQLSGLGSQPSSQPTSVRGPLKSEVDTTVDNSVKVASAVDEEVVEAGVEVNAAGATAVDLMSLIYNCDAGEELFKGNTIKFNSVVTRVVDPQTPTEVHLDIDRSKLFRDTVFKCSEFMAKKKDLPKAEHLVRTAIAVFNGNFHLEFKLACVLSLQNRLEECLDMLLVAQSNGFDEIHKLENDADLANVRKHPRFIEIVPSGDEAAYELEDEVPAVAPVVQEEPQMAAASAPSPPQPITAEHPDVLSLVNMFPDMAIEEAVCVLVLAKGSLSRAVNARLSGHYVRPGQNGTVTTAATPMANWTIAAPSAPNTAWAPVQPDVHRRH